MVSPHIKMIWFQLYFCSAISLAPIIVFSSPYGHTILIAPIFGYVFITICDFLIKILYDPDPNSKKSSLSQGSSVGMATNSILFNFLVYLCDFKSSTFVSCRIRFFNDGSGNDNGSCRDNLAHELMHQKSSKEKWLADILMGMALYGTRTEHL